MKRLFCLAWAIVLMGGCGESPESIPTLPKPSTFSEGDYDQQEMEKAIAKARREVDRFIAELGNPTGESHAVKAPITDQEETEHFWLIDLTYEGGTFHGTINNEPATVKNVKLGQKWSIKKEDISDWMFMREGKMHGNYTLRPLLESMPEERAAVLREMLAEP